MYKNSSSKLKWRISLETRLSWLIIRKTTMVSNVHVTQPCTKSKRLSRFSFCCCTFHYTSDVRNCDTNSSRKLHVRGLTSWPSKHKLLNKLRRQYVYPAQPSALQTKEFIGRIRSNFTECWSAIPVLRRVGILV
jgi:hypothetical protein